MSDDSNGRLIVNASGNSASEANDTRPGVELKFSVAHSPTAKATMIVDQRGLVTIDPDATTGDLAQVVRQLIQSQREQFSHEDVKLLEEIAAQSDRKADAARDHAVECRAALHGREIDAELWLAEASMYRKRSTATRSLAKRITDLLPPQT